MFGKLSTILRPGITLSQRTARGVFWITFLKITNRLIQFIRIVVLARFLSPNDFGLMGIALIAISVLEVLSNVGFQPALIQKYDKIKDYLDTAWIISVIRGFLLAFILFITAPFICNFFNSPDALPIMQALAISLVLRALSNIGIVYFQRELEFRAIFIYMFSITLVDTIISVSLAVYLRNIWALVYGMLAGNFVGLIVSYLIQPYRPKFKFYMKRAKELFQFGKWLMLNGIMYFFVENLDSIFIAKFLGTIQLGYYRLAYRFSSIPTREIGGVVYEVAFPAFSRLQNERTKQQETYFKALCSISLLITPLCGIIIVLAGDFIRIFLEDKWMPMVPVLQILIIGAFIAGISEINTPFLQAIGNPDVPAKQSGIRLAVFMLLVYPFSSWLGVTGVAFAVVIAEIIKQPMGYRYIFKNIPQASHKILTALSAPLFSAILATLLIFFLKNIFIQISIISLVFLVSLYAIVYLSVLYLIDQISGKHMMSTLKYFYMSLTS